MSALASAFRLANRWIDGLPDRPVHARATLAELRARFEASLPVRGEAPDRVVERIAHAAEDGLLGSAGGRFFGWVIGGGLPSALAADWLVATWDQNAAVYECGPSVAVIEETAGRWLLEAFDLPRSCSFAFTSGCQLAHVTALAAARREILRRAGWDLDEEGLFGAPPLRVVTNDQHHGSVPRALRFLGLGRRSIVQVATDSAGRVDPAAFEAAVAGQPTIVVMNAADLNVGAFDAFAELIPIAHAHGAWVHVDGAFGLFARASRSKRALADGIELADSWATDAHKWLNVPFDCGVAFIRDGAAHRAAMTTAAPYVAASPTARDAIDWNPEWSRRARGVPVYAALSELGRDGLEDLVDRSCTFAAQIVEGLSHCRGARVLAFPKLNQGLVRFEQPGASQEENDAYTDDVVRRINETGEAFFSPTTWRGQRAMRVSVVNWRTTEKDVARAVAAVKSILG
jgi:glutamate/tyrosine decarboxylase-like PLP-dependent enzyme